jgi:nucleoside-diphosphate-sugar epimerase
MRIFVTGAGGFIGKYLVPLLYRHRVLAVDLADPGFSGGTLSFVKGDLTQDGEWMRAVESFSPEVLIHLGWLGLPDYSAENNLVNYNLSVKLFKMMSRIGCRKTFSAGTCWEYGSLRGQCAENAAGRDLNPFAVCKAAVREAGEAEATEKGLTFIWGRIFFVYGPGQRTSSLIPSGCRAFIEGRYPVIKNFHSLCDFIHISDVAAAIYALVDTADASGIYNIGSGVPAKVGDVCNLVADYAGRKDLVVSALQGESSGFWADISRIRQATGWRPAVTLKQGVQETVCYLQRECNDRH